MANAVIVIEYVMFMLVYALCFYYLKTSDKIVPVAGITTFVHVIFTIYVCINLYGTLQINNTPITILAFAIIVFLGMELVSFIIFNISLGDLEKKYKEHGRQIVYNKKLSKRIDEFLDTKIVVMSIIFLLLFVYYMNGYINENIFGIPHVKRTVISMLCIGVLSVSSINVNMSNDIMKMIEKVNVNVV